MKSKQFKILIAFIITFLTISYGVQLFYIYPRYLEQVNGFLRKSLIGYVVYKNNHRGKYLYLSKKYNKIEVERLNNVSENEIFDKPKSSSIEEILMINNIFYDKAIIGDKIEKLPNSNKCFLYKKDTDSIFRYNCRIISKEDREKMPPIEEWKSDEIGFWKLRYIEK